MKNKKMLIIVAVVLALVLITGIIAMIATKDLVQAAKLRKEVSKISNIDITEDEIDMKIKTKGNYGVIEDTIKNYMNDYSTYCKEVSKVLDNEEITKILTPDNYKNDRPDFTDSKNLISSTKAIFNENMEFLISLTNEDAIMERIENKNLDESFIELYRELMLDEEVIKELEETTKSLQEASDSINKLFEVQEKVINLLVENKGRWIINENNEIQFETQKLVDRYNGYLSEL